jgi:hypothetical protein
MSKAKRSELTKTPMTGPEISSIVYRCAVALREDHQMRATDIMMFLNGEIRGAELQRRVSSEAEIWAKKLNERGRSAPVILTDADTPFDLTRQRVIRLLDAFLTRELSESTFSYVLNALLLSDGFRWVNEPVRTTLENLLIAESGESISSNAWSARGEIVLG